MSKVHLTILFALVIIGCKEKTLEVKAYLKWLNDPDNKLSIERYVNGFTIKAKYLSPEYLTYLEKTKGVTEKKQLDSLTASYKKAISFLVTLSPDDNKGDLMMEGVQDYQQYADRFHKLNFNLNEYFSLNTNLGSYKPVLATMENTYGLTKHRNIYLVFSTKEGEAELAEAEYYDLTYQDEFFGLGINHFVFERSTMNNAPVLVY